MSNPKLGSVPGLGEVLVRSRWGWLHTIVYALVFCAATFVLAILVRLHWADTDMPGAILDAPSWYYPVVSGVAGAVLIITVLTVRRRVTLLCADGVWQGGLLHGRTLRYDEVETFSLSLVNHFTNGAYGGTIGDLVVYPRNGSPLRARHMARLLDGGRTHGEVFGPHPYQAIGATLAQLLAPRLLRAIEHDGQVRWVDNVMLDRRGIHLPEFVAWSETVRDEIVEGRYNLYTIGGERPRLRLRTDKTGFLPGLYALAALRGETASWPNGAVGARRG